MPDFRIKSTLASQNVNECAVLAFDPGETTGWCAMIGRQDDPTDLLYIDYGQIDCVAKDLKGWFGNAHKHAGVNLMGENAGISEMVELSLNHFPKSAIVIEDFIPDMKRMDQARHTLSPVRITAGFSFGMSCYRIGDGRLGDERIFIQNRSLAKTTCTDERLKNWGLYDHKSGNHARDAVRHAYYFLRTCKGSNIESLFKRHMAWPHLFGDPHSRVDSDVLSAPASRRPRAIRELGEII